MPSATHEKKFAYAKIGIALWEHQRLHECGDDAAAVCGLMVQAIVYCRAKELDGVIPRAVAEGFLNGAGRRFWHWMVQIGWWIPESDDARHGVRHGVRIANYALFNDTSLTIAENREKARLRASRSRRNKKGFLSPKNRPLPLSPGDSPSHETSRVTHACLPNSNSPSLSQGSLFWDPESTGDATAPPPIAAVAGDPGRTGMPEDGIALAADAAGSDAAPPAPPSEDRLPDAGRHGGGDGDRPSGTYRTVPARRVDGPEEPRAYVPSPPGSPDSATAAALTMAFVEGIQERTGRTYLMPRQGLEFSDMSRAIHIATASSQSGRARVALARQLGAQYAEDMDDAPGNGFDVKDWVNRGMRRKVLAKGGPIVAQELVPGQKLLWKIGNAMGAAK